MKVLCLFADKTASELKLELDQPDPSGDPVMVTVVGAEDLAVRTSAERAVRCAYYLLRRLEIPESRLRYFASFDSNLPAQASFSGDSAGLAFFCKFLCSLAEDHIGKEYDQLALAATGVISDASASAAVNRVDGIVPKLLAAHETLPKDAHILLPQKNLDEINASGDIEKFHPDLIQRLKPIATVADAFHYIDKLIQLKTRLATDTPSSARTRTGAALPAAGPTPSQGFPAPISREMPLWLKRVLLYSVSFLLAPLIALIYAGMFGDEDEPGGNGQAQPMPTITATVTPGPTPPAEVLSEQAFLTGGAIAIQKNTDDPFEKWTWSRLRNRNNLLPSLPSGTRIAFTEIEFSAPTYFYVFICAPEEPFLGELFPAGGGESSENLPANNPLKKNRKYYFPGQDRSFSVGKLPEAVENQTEILYFICSPRPMDELQEEAAGFAKLMNDKGELQARLAIQAFAKKMNTMKSRANVLEVQFNHVK
ncbi:MAG: hypothetical protein ACLFQ6_01475 [Candidatus Sumerlaeia bacterium]